MTAKISITDHDSGEQIGPRPPVSPDPQIIKPATLASQPGTPTPFFQPIPNSEPPLQEMPADIPSPEVPRFGELQPKVDAHPLFSGAMEPAPKKRRWWKRTLAPLLALIVLIVILYLAIDAGLVKGYSHLPFHFFKAPVTATTPTITAAKTTTTPTTADPYTGWKTYTLPNEKASFKYPFTWILKNDNGDQTNLPTDQDAFEINAPDGFILSIGVGAAGGYGGDDSEILSADSITFIGVKDYLQYKSWPVSPGGAFSGTVDSGTLSTSPNEKYKFPPAKNNITNKNSYSQTTEFNINFTFPDRKGVKTASNNQDINTAKLIIESMSY